MQQTAFVKRRSETWQRLDALLVRCARRGVRALPPQEVDELGRLYRSATSDLAYARGRDYDRALLEYLNRLTARGHAEVYASAAQTGRRRIVTFYRETFPREFRRSIVFIATCTALTVAASVVSWSAVRAHPEQAYAMLPGAIVPDGIRKSLHDSNFSFDRHFSPAVSTAIVANNVKVAVVAFAGSITLGLLTLYVIADNGLLLGGLGAMFANAGFGYDYWATIAPHGVIELTAIQIAGAAGLLVAAGVLFPGRLLRRDAIAANGRRAGTLFLGVASMLIVAGTIEGFISPQRWPPQARIAIGGATALFMLWYFGFCGRKVVTTDRAA